MSGLHRLEKHNDSPSIDGAVGYWIYNVKEDSFDLSEGIKQVLGLEHCTKCAFSTFKSLIIGTDVPQFVHNFDDWLNGDTSKIIQFKVVDISDNIRVVQMKGRLREDLDEDQIVLYGAYIDISYWSN